MAEQYENNYTTLLNGAIDDNDTTITVDAAPVNMTGDFRIKIDNEIILVGTVSGLTFTGCTRGVEGTTAASHSDNATVRHVLTAAALDNIILETTSAVLIEPYEFLYLPPSNITVLNRTGSGSLGGGYTEDTGQSFSISAGETYRITLTGWGGGTLNMGVRFDPGNVTDAWHTGPTYEFVAPAGKTTGLLIGRNNGANLSWTSYVVEEIHDGVADGFASGTTGRDILAAETVDEVNEVLGIGALQLVTSYIQSATNGTTHNITVSAAASGHRFIVAVSSYNRDVNTPTCTNVTFTQIFGANFSTGVYLSVFLGIVAGGSSGTTISVTATGSNWIITDTYEIINAVSGTVVDSSTLTDTSASAVAGTLIGEVTGATGNLFVIAAAQNDGSTGLDRVYTTQYNYQAYHGANAGLVSGIGVLVGGSLNGYYTGGTSGGDLAAGIVLIS